MDPDSVETPTSLEKCEADLYELAVHSADDTAWSIQIKKNK